MSPTPASSGRTVIERLQSLPHSFSLDQVLRILWQLRKKQGISIGIDLSVHAVPRYYCHEVLEVSQKPDGWSIECCVSALTGSRGVLPHYLRDAALTLEIEASDLSMANFFGIFENHWLRRLVRGRLKYDICAMEESRVYRKQRGLHIADLLVHLLPDMPGGSRRQSDFLCYTCLLGPSHRHLEGLKAILNDYFQLKVVVRAASPRRHRLVDDALVRIGTLGANNSLGRDMPLGSGGYLDSWRVDILLMPVSRKQLFEVLNSPQIIGAVRHLASLYLGDGTPSMVYVMARRRFLSAPIISGRSPKSLVGQSFCLAPGRHPDGVVRIRKYV